MINEYITDLDYEGAIVNAIRNDTRNRAFFLPKISELNKRKSTLNKSELLRKVLDIQPK